MPKFEVDLWEKVVHTIEVEADTEEEAIETAEQLMDDTTGSSQGWYSRSAHMKTVPCGGCGATNNSERCMGCLHDFKDGKSDWVHTAGKK